MTVNHRNLLKIQQEKIFGEPQHLTIVKPCTMGEGILQFSMDDFNDYKTKFEEGSHKVCVFIPASGLPQCNCNVPQPIEVPNSNTFIGL